MSKKHRPKPSKKIKAKPVRRFPPTLVIRGRIRDWDSGMVSQ